MKGVVIIRKKVFVIAILFFAVIILGVGQALKENENNIPNLDKNKKQIVQTSIRKDDYNIVHKSDEDIKGFSKVSDKDNLNAKDEKQDEEMEEDSKIEYIVAQAQETKLSSAPQKAEETKETKESRNTEKNRTTEKVKQTSTTKQTEVAEAKKAEEARIAAEAKKAEEARKAAEAKKAEEARKAAEDKKAEEARKAAEDKKAEEDRKAASGKIAQIAKMEEQEVVRYVNIERDKAGLKPLTFSAELSKVARDKSIDMAENNYFSHTSPKYGSPFQMMKSYGINFSKAAENIASGQISARFVVESWMNSSGHRVNILNPEFNKIGVGFWTMELGRSPNHWTQLFTN